MVCDVEHLFIVASLAFEVLHINNIVHFGLSLAFLELGRPIASLHVVGGFVTFESVHPVYFNDLLLLSIQNFRVHLVICGPITHFVLWNILGFAINGDPLLVAIGKCLGFECQLIFRVALCCLLLVVQSDDCRLCFLNILDFHWTLIISKIKPFGKVFGFQKKRFKHDL